MYRKQFLQTSLLATGAYFLPNVVLALDKPNEKKKLDLIPERMLVAHPNLSDYKYNTDGEVFVNTQLSFIDADKQLIQLPERHYLTHQPDGYGSPTLYFDGKDYFVFVITLFKSYMMNGYVYKYNHQEGFAKQTIYQHENMGWYAFWGQCIEGKPTLYHYNYGNMSMMRSQPLAADNWETERIYMCPPDEAQSLYDAQFKDVNYHTQAHQFGFTYPKITDGYYTYLKFLHQLNELERTAQKDLEAKREEKSSTVWTSKRVPITIREIRNRQSLASETGGCGCADKLDYTQPNDKLIRLLKITNTKAEAIIHDLKKYYSTTIGYYDRSNQYYKLPAAFYCLADNEKSNYPNLHFDGEKYEIYVESLRFDGENTYLDRPKYTHNSVTGFSHKNLYEEGVPTSKMVRDEQMAIASLNQDFDRESHMNNTQYKPPIVYPFLLEEYPNTLQPIYCEGDDLTLANPKPKILYREVPGTKIEIPNMPAYESQDTVGACGPFSLGVIQQKYLCDKFKQKIPDCKNPPPEYKVSNFGLMEYTHVSTGEKKAFNLFDKPVNHSYTALLLIKAKRGLMLLDSCQPFNKLVNSFTTNGIPTDSDLARFKEFERQIKTLYSSRKSNNSEVGFSDCSECLNEINKMVGLNASIEQLRDALKQETFGEFMHKLFFESLDPVKCKRKNLPSYYSVKAYPDSSTIAAPSDIKSQIIEGLKSLPNTPILTPAVCLKRLNKNKCDLNDVHSMVVVGYKKVCDIDIPKNCKDLFKIHNSWGESWQKKNNDGWVDADIYVSSFMKDWADSKRIGTASVIWLE